jgi:hypothetical protein
MTTQEAQSLRVGSLLVERCLKPRPHFLLVTHGWRNDRDWIGATVVPLTSLPHVRLPLQNGKSCALTLQDLERGYVKRIA